MKNIIFPAVILLLLAGAGGCTFLKVNIGDEVQPLEEKAIYGLGTGRQTVAGQAMPEMFASLRFGQPSLLNLPDGEILAVHWAVENGQGKIRTHRLRVRV